MCENIFKLIKNILIKYDERDKIYCFNNTQLTDIFYYIEKNGIKIDKKFFIEHYKDKLQYPEFNILKGKIYTQYNLYTKTGRPSNSYNSINFAALDKLNEERKCYIPENDMFIELDFQGYHPRLSADLINFDIPDNVNIYDYLGVEKIKMFENLYGGIKQEYINKPYFNNINTFINNMWDEYNYGGIYKTNLRVFTLKHKLTANKLYNYILQAKETYENVIQMQDIIKILENKKTKLVLYTYDSFLFDYNKDDGNELIQNIKNTLRYPVGIKQGTNYHGLLKI
jgi:hypothetical protein